MSELFKNFCDCIGLLSIFCVRFKGSLGVSIIQLYDIFSRIKKCLFDCLGEDYIRLQYRSLGFSSALQSF